MDKIRLQLPAADNGCLPGLVVLFLQRQYQCNIANISVCTTILHNVLIRESAHIQM